MTAPTVNIVETALGQVSYGEQGEGRPMVALHSLLTDRRAFDRIAPRLEARVITPDLPGFGATAMVGPEIETYSTLMGVTLDVICDSNEPVSLMGNGLGAFVALGMAVIRPDQIDRLVLVGCGTTFPDAAKPAFGGMITAVETGGIEAVIPTALRRIFTEHFLAANPGAVQERTDVLGRTHPEAFLNACRALQAVDFTERVGGVDTPTLLVVGEEDAATPPEMARQLDDLLPHSELVVLPGVAHAPQIQQPDAFVESIEHFVEVR